MFYAGSTAEQISLALSFYAENDNSINAGFYFLVTFNKSVVVKVESLADCGKPGAESREQGIIIWH